MQGRLHAAAGVGGVLLESPQVHAGLDGLSEQKVVTKLCFAASSHSSALCTQTRADVFESTFEIQNGCFHFASQGLAVHGDMHAVAESLKPEARGKPAKGSRSIQNLQDLVRPTLAFIDLGVQTCCSGGIGHTNTIQSTQSAMLLQLSACHSIKACLN
eukprot:scaffold24063_cov17-Tisochrysis_lutea.AAC.2